MIAFADLEATSDIRHTGFMRCPSTSRQTRDLEKQTVLKASE